MITIFESPQHKNIMYHDLTGDMMVQSNQHVIIDRKDAILLDPGGHKVYTTLLSQISREIPLRGLKHIFFSHQDPDVITAANGWLMVTDANAYLPELWMRFFPHFGIDNYVLKRLEPIPDKGMNLEFNGKILKILPAHFLHSAGNFHLYDPSSKILYTGDVGASMGQDYFIVEDFESHISFMENFHKRYLAGNKALKIWLKMVRRLDVQIIAPQHGAIFPNRTLVEKFFNWLENLQCGLDLLDDEYNLV